MTYPDPFLPTAFEIFVDVHPARTLGQAAINAEGHHWSQWLRAHDYIGQAPRPGRAVFRLSVAVEVFGCALTWVGPAGYVLGVVADVSTLGGFGGMIAGAFLSSRAVEQLRPELEAIALVDMRLADLAHAKDRMQQEGRWI